YSCFFQAEDGIRDATVTGVQTCARPASPEPIGYRSDAQLAPMVRSRGTRPDEPPAPPTRWHPAPAGEVWQSPTIVVPSYSPLCPLPRPSAATGAGGNSRARKYAL